MPANGGYGVAFSPDGKRLAVSSVNRTVTLWDLSRVERRSEEPLILSGHSGAVYRVVFSPDGRRLVTASRDGTSRVFAVPVEDLVQVARSRVTRDLTPEECRQYLHAERCPSLR